MMKVLSSVGDHNTSTLPPLIVPPCSQVSRHPSLFHLSRLSPLVCNLSHLHCNLCKMYITYTGTAGKPRELHYRFLVQMTEVIVHKLNTFIALWTSLSVCHSMKALPKWLSHFLKWCNVMSCISATDTENCN